MFKQAWVLPAPLHSDDQMKFRVTVKNLDPLPLGADCL